MSGTSRLDRLFDWPDRADSEVKGFLRFITLWVGAPSAFIMAIIGIGYALVAWPSAWLAVVAGACIFLRWLAK